MSVRVPGYRARYLLVSGGPFFEAGGEKLGAVVVMRDHTERRQMEQERERLTKELQQKNEELESLIYAASHDLRSPLVNIEGFSRRLGLVCQELAGLADHPALPAELRQRTSALTQVQLPKAMHYIQAGVTKMGGLINGLLRLSRLGRVSVTLEPLDMNRLLLQVLAALTYQIQKAEAEVVVGSLPRCQGDQNLLNQVFSNLLDNALKYRDPVRRLQIRVSGRREGADVLYCVEDTGIGIAPEHQERVWELFHRLRPEGPVAGEGLGLNLVRRIVGRHQGRIWLESAPGVGSRFIIALPVAPP
jgi:signal transduction histidine kinase